MMWWLKQLLIVVLLFFIMGCALPVPLSYGNYIRMTYDTTQIIKGDPTVGDYILSSTTGMECQFLNIVNNQTICAEKSSTKTLKEYVRDNSQKFIEEGEEQW